MADWPYNFSIWVSSHINDFFETFVKTFKTQIKLVKTYTLFFIMLPTKIGFQQAVSPFTWGFQLEMVHKIFYFISFIVVALWFLKNKKNEIFIFLLLLMIFLYFGLTNMPWLSLLLIYSFFAWQVGGYKLALGTFWTWLYCSCWNVARSYDFSLSLWNCCCFLFIVGTSIGIWAAHNTIVSAIVRPINDTLQTIPLFVILIPFVMLLKLVILQHF